MARPVKLRGVGSSGQEHPNFVAMLGVVVILLDALTNFRRCDSNNRVRVCVIFGGPVEDFHTKDALFELVGLTGQCSRHNKS